MGDHGMSLVQRERSALALWRDYPSGNRENAASQLEFHHKLLGLMRTHLHQAPANLTILEIGCGQRATQTMLLQAVGAQIMGIDREFPTYRLGLARLGHIIRINGWERALKSWLRHVFFDQEFFRELSRQAGQKFPPDRVNVGLMNAAHLAFPDDSFDFIFSSLVFEHIDNVAAAAAEVNRVLRAEGTAWINVHLFPSLSGGHHKDWTDPRKWPSPQVPPWDHLRENRYPADPSLNKLHLEDYRRIFAASLTVLEESRGVEGEEILTPELETELTRKGYSQEDLLVREVAFRCRKRPGPHAAPPATA